MKRTAMFIVFVIVAIMLVPTSVSAQFTWNKQKIERTAEDVATVYVGKKIQNRIQKDEKKEIENMETEAREVLRKMEGKRIELPFSDEDVAISPIVSESRGYYENYDYRATGIGLKAVENIFAAWNVQMPGSPELLENLKRNLGVSNGGRHEGGILPPYVVTVGVYRIADMDQGSRTNYGYSYYQDKRQRVCTATVDVKVYKINSNGYQQSPKLIASSNGYGRSVVGAYASQQFGGQYGRTMDYRSDERGAVFHAVADALANLKFRQ